MAIIGKCKICNWEVKADAKRPDIAFMSHHRNFHKISRAEVYNMYYFKTGDNECKECGTTTEFYKHRKMFGYKKYCSFKCESKSSHLIKNLNQDKKFQEKMQAVCSTNGKNHVFTPAQLDKLSKNRVGLNKANAGRGGQCIEHGEWKLKSTWEKEFAEMCDASDLKYAYESKTFLMSNGKRYTPDFYLPTHKTWVEVKPKRLTDETVMYKGQQVENITGEKWYALDQKDFPQFVSQLELAGV